MSDAAGKVQVVLSVDKATYSQAMQEAQRQLDVFAGKSKSAGAAHVSSMQASSAAIRTLEGDWTRNTRAVEKFITMIPGVGNALKVMFPLVGGIAFASLLGEMGVKVVDFIKKANEMPQAIRAGFAALTLEQQTSIDSTVVLTDKLNDAHAAFEHKPSDALKLGIDEAREAADKFAASIVAANNKVEELLSKNSSGFFSALLLGKPMTGAVQTDFSEYQRVQAGHAYDLANAAPGSDAANAAQKAINDTMVGFIRDQQSKLPFRQAQGGAVAADAQGVLTDLLNQQRAQGADTDHASAEAQAAKDEAAKKATEQAKAAAAKQIQAMTEGLNALKLVQNMTVKSEYDYWDARRNAFTKGSDAYNEVVTKQAELAVAAARSAHETITEFQKTQRRDAGELAPDWQRGMDAWNKQIRSEQTQSSVDSNQSSITDAQNTAKQREAEISEQVGRTLTKFDAAVALANVHTTEYTSTLMSLQAIVDARAADAKADPSAENQKALAAATKALADALSVRGIQVGKDNLDINGAPSSGFVGAADAIHDFINASKDAASQMHNLVTNTLNSLNTQLVNGMMGQRTNFRQVGSNLFRGVATSTLEKGEGAVMGALGLGKLGTKSNPMHVIVDGAGAAGHAVGAVASAVGSAASGATSKLGGFFGSMLKTILPGFADGGYIDGPAIVGENGPELFNPGTSGHIVPNYKLTSGSSGGDIHFHPGAIDARGATDPAQVQAMVERGIRKAAPQLTAAAVRANREQKLRRPSTARA